jgi:hypothetical protein
MTTKTMSDDLRAVRRELARHVTRTIDSIDEARAMTESLSLEGKGSADLGEVRDSMERLGSFVAAIIDMLEARHV